MRDCIVASVTKSISTFTSFVNKKNFHLIETIRIKVWQPQPFSRVQTKLPMQAKDIENKKQWSSIWRR